jgi:tRNA dimethylallyltransferase
MSTNKVIIVSGPTASGKTNTSIKLAKKFNAEVVNFDSLLFYKELNKGTAKPTKAEQNGVLHHLIDTHSIKSPINAADYMRLAEPVIKDIHERGLTAILVGGSGFYLQTLLKGMYKSKTTPQEILEKSEDLYQKEGISPFLSILQENDPESFSRYHENDHYRIRRAVEYYWANHSKLSDARKEMPNNEDCSAKTRNGWDVYYSYLDIEKDIHWEIIQTRTSKMIESGLIEEVASLLEKGFSPQLKPLQSIGYKETIDYLNAAHQDTTELKERISIATRQLAKAQRTWFKKEPKISYNALSDYDKLEKDCEEFLA